MCMSSVLGGDAGFILSLLIIWPTVSAHQTIDLSPPSDWAALRGISFSMHALHAAGEFAALSRTPVTNPCH
jgi:hypothetical protein